MSINLSPELAKLVEEAMASGEFGSEEELFVKALRKISQSDSAIVSTATTESLASNKRGLMELAGSLKSAVAAASKQQERDSARQDRIGRYL